MSLLEELEWRGLLQDVSDREGLEKLPKGTPFYIGFDPTAPSFQIGNLIPLIVAGHLSRAGLKPIILFGGATGTIGDPGGKSAERVLLELDRVAANVALQQNQVRSLLTRMGFEEEPTFVNNLEWTKDVSILTFLRDVGKHFTVNYMMAKDSVKNRLSGDGISYTEFSYMLLQSFDYLHLFQNMKVRLQIGGSDQWGNITAGLELIRRKLSEQAFALSFPLITDSQGKKFGKSAGNAMWLDPSMVSPYKFHQFWLNTPDSDVIKLLKLFTLMTREEIALLESEMIASPESRRAQRALADAVCNLVHGDEATREAVKSAEALFGGSLEGLSSTQLLDLFSEAPTTEILPDEVINLDLLSLLAKTVAKSKGEARRLIAGGGIYVDNQRATDEALKIADTNLPTKGLMILRSGKKNYHVVKLAV